MAQVIELDASGDFIIELSSQSSDKTHLLVSSKVLTLLSPVLGKMFEWETRARADGEKGLTTPVIPLPDDDEEVFTIICQIAHHKMEDIPDTLKPEVLATFAEICHKYDCIRSFTHSSFRWLRRDFGAYAPEYLNKLLFAAYTLNICDAFGKISRKILFLQVGPFKGLPGFTDHDLVDRDDLLDHFNVRRIKLINHLMGAMLSPLTKPLNGSCEQSSLMIGRYMKELKRRRVWPRSRLQNWSVSDVLQKRIAEPIRRFCASRHCTFCSERDFKFADELRKAKEAFVHQNGGLCLDCVLTRMESFRKGHCRIKHEEILDNCEIQGGFGMMSFVQRSNQTRS